MIWKAPSHSWEIEIIGEFRVGCLLHGKRAQIYPPGRLGSSWEAAMHAKQFSKTFICLQRGENTITRYVEREVLNHSLMLHPHIIQFKEVFLTQKYLAIAMEYADGGDMFQHVKSRRGLLEYEVWSVRHPLPTSPCKQYGYLCICEERFMYMWGAEVDVSSRKT